MTQTNLDQLFVDITDLLGSSVPAFVTDTLIAPIFSAILSYQAIGSSDDLAVVIVGLKMVEGLFKKNDCVDDERYKKLIEIINKLEKRKINL